MRADDETLTLSASFATLSLHSNEIGKRVPRNWDSRGPLACRTPNVHSARRTSQAASTK